MKLPDHVDHIKTLTSRAFDNLFAGLGFGAAKMMEATRIPEALHAKRNKIAVLINDHTGETGSYETAREKALDELTFTLFNRLAAIKVMEARRLFPPILTKQAEHGGRSFGHKAWLELNPDMRQHELEGLRDYIKYEFNRLGEALPLYYRSYPYALLPNAIALNEIITAFNAVETDNQVGDDIWQSDDILGWLYESYNNDKKKIHKESGSKTEYNKVSIQSQVYTPRWVVEFLVNNSLGKLYLEMYPDSAIRNKYKIALAPAKRTREIKPLHEIKMIDIAVGSGNFVLYGFDLFYDLYTDQIENYGAKYDEDKIPQLIIQNNLHGIDLDDRAVQLAQLGLWIKARQKQRNTGHLNFNVVSTGFFLPDYTQVQHIFETNNRLDREQQNIVREIWGDLQQAYKFGSLVKIEEKISVKLHGMVERWSTTQMRMFDEETLADYETFKANFLKNLQVAVSRHAQQQGASFLTGKTTDAITFLRLLTTRYDVAVANPPYTDSADFGPELKKFVEDNYKKPFKFNTNLYATFIKRCYEITADDGKLALIHPLTFMYIKTFEDVRKFIINNTHISIFVDYGLSNLFGAIMVDPAFYVLEKKAPKAKSLFISLDQYTRTPNEKFKKDFCLAALEDFTENRPNKHNITLSQEKLKIIKGWPFIYWISDGFREKFIGNLFEEIFPPKAGLQTANNERFLRFWWEVDEITHLKKWFKYAKGGPYNKWFGNIWLTVNWSNNGNEIKSFTDDKGKVRSRPQNESFYLKEGITYSTTGSKGASFRYLPPNHLFDMGGSSLFPSTNYKNTFYALGLFNSEISSYIVDCLNPTVNTQIGDLQRIPFVKPTLEMENKVSLLSSQCVNIKKELCSYSLIETNFKQSPLLAFQEASLKERLLAYLNFENLELAKVLVNEAIINRLIFEVYELSPEDREQVIAKMGVSVGDLPVAREALAAFEAHIAGSPSETQEIVLEHLGTLEVTTFDAQVTAAIQEEFANLYQSNNDLEEFCIRHQVNPINVWYWFGQSKVLPRQRTHDLAMEFLANMIREILMDDDDGLIPLVKNAGEKVLLDRIEEQFIQKGFTMAQYSSFDSLLGRELNEYLSRHFFRDLSDHLNLFMYLPKTPFIWHLTSGPMQGFDCYLIIYKWSRDKLMRIRSVYVENRERALRNRQSDLATDNSARAQNEKETIYRQLKEIETFKQKIDALLAEGYNPILDDGVGKNIAPLQAKGMLACEVLNPGQLKKYLNADW